MKNQEKRVCQNCQKKFEIVDEDFNFYKKVDVPPPTFCPDCRYQRRLMNRNEWIFYRRPCDLCKKEMVTIHNPDYPGKVYCQLCWWSDKWDSLSYGRDFDFNRPFFEQFHELRLATPRIAMTNTKSVNSEYTNQSENNKNCYLCVSTGECENCLYGYWNNKSRDCVDCYAVAGCELLYAANSCINCSKGAFLEACSDCSDSYFLKSCRGCTHCFGCYAIRGKSYCWFNEQLSPEEYKKRFSRFVFSRQNIQKIIQQCSAMEASLPHKFYHGRNNIASKGNYLVDTKNVQYSFNCRDAENLRYCQDAWFSKDSYDSTEVYSELCYEIEGCIATRCGFVAKTWDTFDSWYLDLCFNGNNLFGCISLREKSYCILNKQYSKEEYGALLSKIIKHMKKTGEWGEFFPASISSFAYNETVAQDYFPLTKEQAFAKGYRWYERKDREYKADLRPDEVPKTIQEADDSILDKTILCKTQLGEEDKKKYYNCTHAFRITKAELDFYRKLGLPLPEKCFHDRRQDLMALRNPRKLYHRACMCDGSTSSPQAKTHSHHSGRCPNEFETSYPPRLASSSGARV